MYLIFLYFFNIEKKNPKKLQTKQTRFLQILSVKTFSPDEIRQVEETVINIIAGPQYANLQAVTNNTSPQPDDEVSKEQLKSWALHLPRSLSMHLVFGAPVFPSTYIRAPLFSSTVGLVRFG